MVPLAIYKGTLPSKSVYSALHGANFEHSLICPHVVQYTKWPLPSVIAQLLSRHPKPVALCGRNTAQESN